MCARMLGGPKIFEDAGAPPPLEIGAWLSPYKRSCLHDFDTVPNFVALRQTVLAYVVVREKFGDIGARP